MAVYTIQDTTLTAIADAIREKTGSTNTIKPTEMADMFSEVLIVPEEAYKLSGNCQNRFSFGGLNWLIDIAGDKITTTNIDGAQLFYKNETIETIPFSINWRSSTIATDSMFEGCKKLKVLPKITNFNNSNRAFYECPRLISLNNNQLTGTTSLAYLQSTFNGCCSLRSIDNFLDNIPDFQAGNSIYGYYDTFNNCYSMDELTNLPFIYSTYNSQYSFYRSFSYCFRLKELTFRGGVASIPTPKGCVINLNDYVGYQTPSTDYLTGYGFTNDTRVIDDETYQMLKDNPDYWTSLVDYSRYNHTSAVNTLNSLPDCSALNASYTIKFKGQSGSKTDGGAINTLTEEEIAVATAKGWTVSLV